MKQTITGREVQEGDRVYFPNSRRPQEVGSVTPTGAGTNVLLSADGSARWVVPDHYDVEREVSDHED